MQRLFFAMAGALLLAIVAIVATAGYFQVRGVARSVDGDTLDASQAVQGELVRLRGEGLQQVTGAIAGNAALVAYVNRALGSADAPADVHSIQDQLEERRAVLGLDVLAILLPSGRLVASTGKDMPQIHEFGRDDRFIQASRTATTTAGMWSANEQVTWQVAFSPMVQGGSEVAMLLAGRRHDARVAREIAGTSRADYALVVGSDSGPLLAASSLDAETTGTLAKALRAHPEWMAEAAQAANARAPLALGGFTRPVRVHVDADAGVSWLTIAPKAHVDARARAVTVPLLFALAGVLLVLGAAMWWVWHYWVSPLLALARVADHSAVGDYSLAFEPRGVEAVRQIGNALNRAQAQLGRYRPAPGAPRRRNTDRT